MVTYIMMDRKGLIIHTTVTATATATVILEANLFHVLQIVCWTDRCALIAVDQFLYIPARSQALDLNAFTFMTEVYDSGFMQQNAGTEYR